MSTSSLPADAQGRNVVQPKISHVVNSENPSLAVRETLKPEDGVADRQRRAWPGVVIHHRVSKILGFREDYSLLLFFIFGGALVAFCLARSMTLNNNRLPTLVLPGEWFWYSKPLFRPNIFIHIHAAIIGSIFSVLQFLPVIRRKAILFHRINGFWVLTLTLVGTVCGSIVARHSFGGELNVQSAFYSLGLAIVFFAAMGIIQVKETRKHRQWMLRTMTYTAAPISARLIVLCARQIITHIGTYYTVWRCDEILFSITDPGIIQASYPQCAQIGAQVNPGEIHLAVRASTRGDAINFASSVRITFGMALWIAMALHAVGIELYIAFSAPHNQVRRGYNLEPIGAGENKMVSGGGDNVK